MGSNSAKCARRGQMKPNRVKQSQMLANDAKGSHQKKKLPNFGHRPKWGGSAAQPNLLSKKGMDMF